MGNASVTGETFSRDFPLANAFQPVYGEKGDAFVTARGQVEGLGQLEHELLEINGSGFARGAFLLHYDVANGWAMNTFDLLMDESERRSVLSGAESSGIPAGSPSHGMLRTEVVCAVCDGHDRRLVLHFSADRLVRS